EEYLKLGKWIKIVRDNARNVELRAPGDNGGYFTMARGKVADFKEVFDNFRNNLSANDIHDYTELLKDEERIGLHKYFTGISSEEVETYGDPINSVEELMTALMTRYGGIREGIFKTGGRYELMNIWGEAQVQHFWAWIINQTELLKSNSP